MTNSFTSCTAERSACSPIEQAAAMLAASLVGMFVALLETDQAVRDLGHVATDRLKAILLRGGGEDLATFSRELRWCVATCLSRGNFDSAVYWAVIDCIGFVEDSTNRGWRYMTDSDRLRRLVWAAEKSAEIENWMAKPNQPKVREDKFAA